MQSINDTQLHVGLNNVDLRDGVSKMLSTRLESEDESSLHMNFRAGMSSFEILEYDMALCNLKFRNVEYQKVYAMNKYAARLIMDLFGWKVFDVSEHIPRKGETYRPFIGTVEELKEVFTKNNIEVSENWFDQ